MNENFYPESEEILFTNREKELETLEFYLEEFLNGIKENVCIFGLRRIGKTILIREFVKRHTEHASQRGWSYSIRDCKEDKGFTRRGKALHF